MVRKACVIGDGGWGTALAMVLHANGQAVNLWGPFPDYLDSVAQKNENTTYLPGIKLPGDLQWIADPAKAVDGADIIVLAVPTKYYRTVLERFTGLIPAHARLVSVAKGLDQNTHQRMSQVAQEVLNVTPIAALSGPSHAEEVARGIPTAVTIASNDEACANDLQAAFANRVFRVYTADDVVGVELGGALKNVIAIAVGVSDGLGFGDNTRAALITRGLVEIARLGEALGANPATFAGLSGMGDLIVTCTSKLSRNRGVGERIGRGETIEEIMGSMKQVAEGVWNCSSGLALARDLGVDVPVTEQVYQIVQEHKDPRHGVRDLLDRDFTSE